MSETREIGKKIDEALKNRQAVTKIDAQIKALQVERNRHVEASGFPDVEMHDLYLPGFQLTCKRQTDSFCTRWFAEGEGWQLEITLFPEGDRLIWTGALSSRAGGSWGLVSGNAESLHHLQVQIQNSKLGTLLYRQSDKVERQTLSSGPTYQFREKRRTTKGPFCESVFGPSTFIRCFSDGTHMERVVTPKELGDLKTLTEVRTRGEKWRALFCYADEDTQFLYYVRFVDGVAENVRLPHVPVE